MKQKVNLREPLNCVTKVKDNYRNCIPQVRYLETKCKVGQRESSSVHRDENPVHMKTFRNENCR
jgi:hypothetical protein